MNWNKVDIIIPLYGQHEYLDILLKSLDAPRGNITIINDKPSDRDSKYLKDLDVKVIHNDKNLGFAGTVNNGFKHTTGEYVFVVNSDIEIPCDQDPFGVCYEELESGTDVVGIMSLFEDGTIYHGGMELIESDPIVIGRFSSDYENYNKRVECDVVNGAFMAINRKAYNRVRGFYEGYGMYYEDMDFCLKCKRAGRKVVYRGDTWVWHYASKSVDKKTIDMDKNKQLFLKRNANSTM